MYNPTDQEKGALSLIQSEKNAFEHSSVWVSDGASFNIRE